MGLLDYFRRKKELTEVQKMAIQGALVRTQAEREDAIYGGAFNLELIRDEGVEKWLDVLAEYPMKVDGTLLPNLDWLSLRFLISSQRRTSFLDQDEADIATLENRRFLRRFKMRMSEVDYEGGAANLLESIRFLNESAISDSIGGRKAKLTKVRGEHLEVSVPQQQQKGQQRSIL